MSREIPSNRAAGKILVLLDREEIVPYNHFMQVSERRSTSIRKKCWLAEMVLPAMVILSSVLLAWVASPAAYGAEEDGRAPFRQGSIRASLFFGNGRAFDQNYRTRGLGLGCYVADGLEAGIEAETWRGSGPAIDRVSPHLQFVFPTDRDARPYAGVFWRESFIEGYRNTSDAGGRAGLLFLVGKSAYVGAGLAYERHLGCDSTVYDACSETYPELLVAVIF